MPKKTFEERFWDKVSPEPNSGCWIWTACATNDGYGLVKAFGRFRLAHRASYEYFVGPIPLGLQLDHKCRVRCCVNPDHLEPVTVRENVMRGTGPSILSARRSKIECLNGHTISEHAYVRKDGTRRCKLCESNRSKNRTPEQLEKQRVRQKAWLAERKLSLITGDGASK